MIFIDLRDLLTKRKTTFLATAWPNEQITKHNEKHLKHTKDNPK